MFAISVGYPLGVKNDKYIVESKMGRIALSFQEAAVWMAFNGVKEVLDLNEDKIYFDVLVKCKIIVKADTLEELLRKIYSVCPIRQGVGSLDNDKKAIIMDENVFYPSEETECIWNLSNGARSFEKIYQYCKKTYNLTEDEFMRALDSLDERDLVFLV